MTKTKPSPILLLDDHRGIYIPRDFASCVDRWRVTGTTAEDYEILGDPDHEHYWEVWQDVCDNAVLTDADGTEYSLYQDGALWMIPVGMEWDDMDGWYWPLEECASCGGSTAEGTPDPHVYGES